MHDFWDRYHLMHFYSKVRPTYRKPRLLDILRATCTLLEDANVIDFLDQDGVYIESEDELLAKKSDWELIACKLTPEEGEHFTTWLQGIDLNAHGLVTEVTALDYKVSITWVDKSNAFCVSVTGRDEHKHNAKKTLSSWSDDPFEALAMCLYKIDVVYEGKTWVDRGTPQNWG